MSDDKDSWLGAKAWHGEKPYGDQELVRIERACEYFRADSGKLAGRRYELLDAGCGVGPLRQFLPAEQFCIRGLEYRKEAAVAAARNYDSCAVGDVEQPWPVEAGGFDGVHAGAILEHVPNWHAPLNHANRALRDGGLLVISVPNLRYWKEIRKLIVGKQPHWLTDMGHLHGYTPRFLRELVTIHGFEVQSLQADRVNILGLPNWRFLVRWFAGIGSVLVLSARLKRRVRVENGSLSDRFPNHKPVGLRSIEVLDG